MVRRSAWRLVLFLFVCFTSATSRGQTNPIVAIRAGRLLDPRAGQTLSDQIILIDGDKISEVGPADRIHIPSGAQVIDLSGATVLPGLIDAHTHIFLAGHDSLESVGAPRQDIPNTTLEYRTLVALANTQADLRAGFTTLRDLGNHGNMYADVDLRNAIDAGLVIGPRLLVSTLGISSTGEALQGSPETILPPEYQPVDSPSEARRAVRQQIHYGADVIKLRATGRYYFEPSGRLVNRRTLTLDEITAVVDEAHSRGAKVSCHAFAGEGLRECIEAGVDTIEHAIELSNPWMDKMKERGIYMVPTIYHYHLSEYTIPDKKATGGKNSLALMREESFKRAVERGLKIGFGTGVGPFPHGSQTKEFEYMVKFGMTPLQAIRAATVVDAEMIGWQDRVGAIEKGKYADIIAVSSDPLSDITELERVKFVMKGGQVVRNEIK